MADFLRWLGVHTLDLAIILATTLVAIICGILRGMPYFTHTAPLWWWFATPVAWLLLWGIGLVVPWRHQQEHRSYWAWTAICAIATLMLIIGQTSYYQRVVTGYAQPVELGQVQVATSWGPMYFFHDESADTRVDLSRREEKDRAYVVRWGWTRPHIVVVDIRQRARASQGAIRAWNARPWLREIREDTFLDLHQQLATCGDVGRFEAWAEETN